MLIRMENVIEYETIKMDIVFCIDNNYVMPCGIVMVSVLENNKNTLITFHIIGMDLSENSKNELLAVADLYTGATVLLYDIKKEMLESYNFSLYDSPHLSLAAYSRLFLIDILPKNVDKAIYLDADMIVTNSLSELWNTDISDYAVAGVPDPYCMFHTDIYKNFGYNDTFQYINSGVLLMNLKYWREHNLKDRFIQFYNENSDKLLYHDQDIINGTLHDSILYLPIKYNVTDFYYLTIENKQLRQYKDEASKAIYDPLIIHYTSTFKPWLKICRHPLRKVFLKYKNVSPWKDVPLSWNDESFGKKIRFYKRLLLSTLGLRKKNRYLPFKQEDKQL